MALWGNKDSKTATGTVSIADTGVVTGSSTLFTTEAKIGNTIRAASVDYQIVTITSDTVAKVIMGTNNGNGAVTTCSAQSYTLSEKPAFVAHESASSSSVSGASSSVFGVDGTEESAGGDNVTNVAVATGGSRYLGAAPTVTITAPASLTIPTTAVSTAADTITSAGHKLLTGTKLTYLQVGATAITGLTDNTAYFAIVVDADTFKLASSLSNAQAGTAINLTGTGSSTQTFTGDTAAATASIAGGVVTAITVTNVGSAYISVPTVTIAKPARIIPTSGVNTSTETITYATHGLTAGEEIKYYHAGGTELAGLTNGTSYYPGQVTTNTFKLYNSAARGTTAVATMTIATTGVNTTTNFITSTAHGLVDGAELNYNNQGGTSITGLTSGTDYFVVNKTTDTFQLALTSGGAAIDITGTGNNAQTFASTGNYNLTGTGNNAQYFELTSVTAATATLSLGAGSSSTGGTTLTHAGWVRRTVGTGGRAGRVNQEVLVAMGSITGDQADDIQYPDA
jgi:hypothetical protein